MNAGLQKARAIAKSLRFPGDPELSGVEGLTIYTDVYGQLSAYQDLEINRQVTPELADGMDVVCDRMGIPREVVRAFVYADSEFQASCFSLGGDSCVIRFSSGLISLLDTEEFKFAAGHELGHFLLHHGASRIQKKENDSHYQIEERAREISSDRLGLIACESLDVAIRGLMKITSGLTARYLRFDVGKYLSQLTKEHDMPIKIGRTMTHPPIAVRCRALLWFSMEDREKILAGEGAGSLNELNRRIEQDLDLYVDGSYREKLEVLKSEMKLWQFMDEVAQEGVFTREKQSAFSSQFGEEDLYRIKLFIADMTMLEIKKLVQQKLVEAEQTLEAMTTN